MKKALFAVLAVLALPASAVILPLRIGFQGKLIDPATNLPKNGIVQMQFRIYDVPTGGTALYTEPAAGFTNVSVVNGVFAVQIGTAALLNTDLFAGASAYLGVTVSPDAEMLPRQPLSMSAYSFTSMQLVSHLDIRVNAGNTYSTFTSAGNLVVSDGVFAATGTFAAQGNDVYSVFSSSGINMSSGTLRLGDGSRGLDATGTGIVSSTAFFRSASNGIYGVEVTSGMRVTSGTFAMNGGGGIDARFGIMGSTGVFTSAANGIYGLTVTSGVRVASGTLRVDAGGGIDVRYGVKASTFVGNGADLAGTTPQVSNSSGSTTTALVAGTEVVVISTNIAPMRNNKTVLLMGFVQVNRVANAVATCTVRYRFNAAGACGTGSTQFYAYTFTMANTASLAYLAPVYAQHAPASTADISYCLTLVCNQAHNFTTRSLNLMTAAP